MNEPDFMITLRYLASWNDLLGIARKPGAVQGMIQKWRKVGKDQAIWYAERAGHTIARWDEYEVSPTGREHKVLHEKIDPCVFTTPVAIVLQYWRPTAAVYDSFNPLVKPVVDGFVDAGLLVKDDNKYVPDFSIKFAGVDESLKLSDEAKALRAAQRKGRKSSLLTPARYEFGFYLL